MRCFYFSYGSLPCLFNACLELHNLQWSVFGVKNKFLELFFSNGKKKISKKYAIIVLVTTRKPLKNTLSGALEIFKV